MRRFGWLMLVAVVVGCGARSYDSAFPSGELARSAIPTSPSEGYVAYAAKEAKAPAMMAGMAGEPPRGATGEEAPQAGVVPPGLPRKIIYNADIGLVVENFAAVEPRLTELVGKYNGYIADQNLEGSPGAQRSGRWKVRVPVDAFESFLADITALGELERKHRTSEDVSEQFYDLEARIKNKKVEEDRLIKILEENTGKIEDILKVEVELTRVRGEIEQMQGRMRVLENLTALTTVTISVREREKYQPPPPVAASFPVQIERAFKGSLDRLIELGQAVVLFCVAAVVWLPLVALGTLLAWLLGRVLLAWLVTGARRAWSVAHVPIFPPRPPQS